MGRRSSGEWFQDTACEFCARYSCGVGFQEGKYDPISYLCKECEVDPMSLREVRNMDRLELEALDGGVSRVAEYLHVELGGVTDLSKLSRHEARMIVKYAVLGFGDDVRRLAKTGKY